MPGPPPTSVPTSKWLIDPSSHLGTTDMGHKLGGCAPLGGAGSLSNTMWPWPSPTSMPSFILIHPTVWPQRYRQTDGLDRETMVR